MHIHGSHSAIPYDAAPYGEITELTEPIVQTRVMAVLDDCIVLFDSAYGVSLSKFRYKLSNRLPFCLIPEAVCNKLLIASWVLRFFSGMSFHEQMYPHDSKQCLFLGGAYLELEDGKKLSLAEIPAAQTNIDAGYGIGKDYEGGRVLIEGNEYADAIPVSAVDHGQPAISLPSTPHLGEELFVAAASEIPPGAFPLQDCFRAVFSCMFCLCKASLYIGICEVSGHPKVFGRLA